MHTDPTTPTSRDEPFADGLMLHIDERGTGRPILVLHGARGPQSVADFAAALAANAHVFAPTHPGFEGKPRPEWLTDADDLAVTYLDLLDRLDLRDVIVIGFSFGGWVATELAVRNATRLGGLILVDAVGIKVEGQELVTPTRPPASSAARGSTAPAGLPPAQNAAQAANMQTMAVYGRNGFSDPKLRRRLARVAVPALVVWGEQDRVVTPEYGRAYAAALPHGRFELISEAGHLPQIDQPKRLLALVREFIGSIAATTE